MVRTALLLLVTLFSAGSLAHDPISLKSGIARGKSSALYLYNKSYKDMDCENYFNELDLVYFEMRKRLMSNTYKSESDLLGFKIGWVGSFVKQTTNKTKFCDQGTEQIPDNKNMNIIEKSCGELYSEIKVDLSKMDDDYKSILNIAESMETYGVGMILDINNASKDKIRQKILKNNENFDCVNDLKDY